MNNGMTGKFIIARCCDAGVHAGFLEATEGRECILVDAHRLWCWQVPKGASDFLSGVASAGLDWDGSKVGCAVRIHLTDVCELIECSPEAAISIQKAPICMRTK